MNSVVQTGREAFPAIMAAINAGDFSGAWTIALAAIRLEWSKLTSYFAPSIVDLQRFWGKAVEYIGDAWKWLQRQISSVLNFIFGENTATTDSMQLKWSDFFSSVVDSWFYLLKLVQDKMSDWQTSLAKGFLILQYEAGLITKEEGAQRLNIMEDDKRFEDKERLLAWHKDQDKRFKERAAGREKAKLDMAAAQDEFKRIIADANKANAHGKDVDINNEFGGFLAAAGRVKQLSEAAAGGGLYRQALAVGDSIESRQLRAMEDVAKNAKRLPDIEKAIKNINLKFG